MTAQPAGDDYGVAIAHNGGEIYVTGVAYENSASDADWVTIKYKGDGTLIWDEFVQGEDVFFKEDKPVDIAVDSRSFIWVTGYILRNDGSNPNYATISYDGDGGIRWGPIEYSNITNGGNDKATALALQRNNVGHGVYVFVTGLSESAAFGLDYATLRYPADGAVTHAWAARYPGAGADEAFAISVAGNGNTYVAGRSFINGNGYDYLTLRYRLDGSQVNLPTSWHEGFGDDEALAIASSCAGLTHVTGWVTNIVNDYKTFKYAQTTAQTASPSTVIVGPGSIISPPPPGELAAIQSSDDVRLVCRPGAILVEGQFPLVITVTGTSPISVPTEMCLQVEAHTSVANLLQVIEFFDFQNMVWRKIDERKGTPGTDSVVHADAKYDPSVFVQVATNQVQARIKYIALGSVLIYPWFARIDLVKWEMLD